ncbi:MAG: hydantoinase/carbamoylase family amidase [Rhizobiales bacterium]|nr:hydantoinase/carbamoylase family amidase [Hyphomicrobiales bacterium]
MSDLHGKIAAAIDGLLPKAAGLFERVRALSASGDGVTRAAFGEVETAAGMAVADFARKSGLEAGFDHVGNLQVTSGSVTDAPVILASHLDSVPNGGNYDGLAGVIAGVVIQAAFRAAGVPGTDQVRTIGFRGEESPWFGTAYLGSKLLLGQFTVKELTTLTRGDTGLSLLEHLKRLGHPVDDAVLQEKRLRPEAVKAYLELHIEQGPVLETGGHPVGIASAARGNIRYPFARCFGHYAHSAAVPRHLRSDAAMATAKLIAFADLRWSELIAAGHDDLVFTCGIFHTNPAEHAMTKVPGEITFSLNLGATSDAVMDSFHEALLERIKALETEHKVRFDLGSRVGTRATPLDAGIAKRLETAARSAGIETVRMPTVGHDAAMFARAGVASAVLLVRNQNGSHNPEEAMRMEDFGAATKVLGMATADLLAG